MALTADARRDSREGYIPLIAAQVVNTSVEYAASYTCMNSRGHGTSGSRGRVQPWASAIYQIPLGFAWSGVTGNTGASPIPEAQIDAGDTYERVAVTGAGSVADQGRLVFMSDDATWTLTRPTLGTPQGMIVRWYTSTTCLVLRFGTSTLAAIAIAGSGQYTWHLGIVGGTGTTGNMLTGIVAPHHGRITSVYGIVVTELTDADVAIDINLEIGGTNVTGGVISWVSASAIGAKLAGTAVTAANEFHEGDLIDVEATYGTPGTDPDPGLLNLYATVQTDLGL
jgi:hypothetical protein